MCGKRRRIILHDLRNLAINGALERAPRGPPFPLRAIDRSELGEGSVGKDGMETADMIDGLAVDNRARACRVVADHAAQIRPVGRRYLGAELQALPCQRAVQLIENHARLDAGQAGSGIDGKNRVEILAAVENDSGTDGLSRQTRAAAAGRDRDVHLAGNLHGRDDVVHRSGNHHAQGLDLVDARIGTIESA